jgi:hypothetical protein
MPSAPIPILFFSLLYRLSAGGGTVYPSHGSQRLSDPPGSLQMYTVYSVCTADQKTIAFEHQTLCLVSP